MNKMKLIISGELTDLNTYIKADKANRYAGGEIKKIETNRVANIARFSKIPPFEKPVKVKFSWYLKNKKKDLDNVAFAKKFILDGLVVAGVFKNDGQRWVRGFTDDFYYDKERPRTEVEFEELE